MRLRTIQPEYAINSDCPTVVYREKKSKKFFFLDVIDSLVSFQGSDQVCVTVWLFTIALSPGVSKPLIP